jgi:hypothetical protein
LYKKLVKDYVVLGSFGLQVIRSNDGGVAHFYHTPVDKWRSGKAGEDDIVRDFYFSENWDRYRDQRYKPIRVAAFNMENTTEYSYYRCKDKVLGTIIKSIFDKKDIEHYAQMIDASRNLQKSMMQTAAATGNLSEFTSRAGANFENRAVIGLAGFPTSPTQFLDRDQPQGF